MISSSLLVLLLNTVLAAAGWLGVFVESSTPGPGEQGILIVSVIEEGPAEAAGLQKGDRIVRVGKVKLLEFEDLGKALCESGAGEKVRLTVLREGEEVTLPLLLGERPPPKEMERQWVIAAPEAPLFPPSRLERIRRGYLGVDVLPLTDGLRRYFEVEGKGVLVSLVVPGSPAERGGIRTGDVITVVNGTAVEEPFDLQKVVRELAGGDVAEMAILREGKPKVLNVKVGEKEAQAYFFSAQGLRQPQLLLELERGREAYADAMKRYGEQVGQKEFQEKLRRHSREYRLLLEEKKVLTEMEKEIGARLESLNAKLAELEEKLRQASTPRP